ncbi:MFS transporter [Modestobacter excelsi]|uniref:MFS transporter n=1 Tax=Modestobacter excelsi TaxID=2213161 RepID=UPI00110CA628|nr:MFS transporter [Modestobacter excelsi]
MHRGVVASLCLVQFVDVLVVTSATTAIPAVLADLDAPASAAGPIAIAYPTAFGGLLVLGGRLGDRYGPRRVLLAGLVAFTVAGLAGGLAADVVQVVGVRAVQGAAAAVSVPSALALLLHVSAEGPERTTALAWWSAAGAAAGSTGFLVGGALTDALGWRSVFWGTVPVGVLLLAVAVRALPAPPPRDAGRSLDGAGAVLLVAAATGVVAGASLLERPASRAAGAALVLAGLGVGALFAAQQRRAAAPLVPAPAARSAGLRTGTAVSFVNTATTTSAAVLATLVLQDELGASPLQAGLVLMSISAAVVPGSALARPLAARTSLRRVAAIGLVLIAVGDLLLAASAGSRAGIVAGGVVLGVGLGIASVAANQIGTSVPPGIQGSASGIVNTGAQLGTAIGVAVLVLVASAGSYGPFSGTAVGWTVAAAAAGLTAVPLALRRSAGQVAGPP